ncbi:hypothetical protein D3C86_2144820 [compost metagenome]
MARICVQFSSARCSFRAALVPMLKWSSCSPEVTKLSSTAGCASCLFSAHNDAATYCTIIIPEFTPGLATRKAGRPLT